MTIQIIPYQTSYFDRTVTFIAHLNNNNAHHIGYFGTHRADIEHTLLELTPPLVEGFRLALDGDTLIGLLGLEIDTDLGRAWLYGPLIDHPDWQTLADQLYNEVRALIPPSIGQHEIFCEAHNLNCQQFAERHQFQRIGEHIFFTLPRAGLAAIRPAVACDWDPHFSSQFDRLHQQAFPRTYYTAQQLINKRNEHNRLLINTVDGELRGYVFGKVDPDAGEGYIDFIAVHEHCRRQGIGHLLLSAALHWMFSYPAIHKVGLTVGKANNAAVRLYNSVGFERENTMCAFRTLLESSNVEHTL